MNFLDSLLDERTASSWIEQGTVEWDMVRMGRFTASEMHRLLTPAKREMTDEELKNRPKGSKAKLTTDYSTLSEGALTYVNEKVAEILTGQPKSSGYAFPIVWGKEHESEAIEFFERQTGLVVERCGFFTYTDYAGGSPDGLIGNDAIIEVKCPFESVNQVDYLLLTDHFDVRRMYFPYWVQMQSNMVFTNRNKGHFVTYDPRMKSDRHKMQHIEVPADGEIHNLIRSQITLAVKELLLTLQRLSA